MGQIFSHPATIIVVILLIVLLFGAPKLPGMARSLGQSMRIFKSEVKEMKRDDDPNVTVNGQPVADGQPVAGTTAAQSSTQPTVQPSVQQPAAEQPTVITPQPGQPAPTVDQNQRPTA